MESIDSTSSCIGDHSIEDEKDNGDNTLAITTDVG